MLYSLWFRRYAPFPRFGFGFEGDNRVSASMNMKDTARTVGGVSFGPGTVGSALAWSSGTRFSGLGESAQTALGRHYSSVTSAVTVSTATLEMVRFTAQTSGANPMIPGSPDIDTYVDMDVVFAPSAIACTGTIRGDDFPSCEVFVYDGKGKSMLLFHFKTTADQDTGPGKLFGAHEKKKLGDFCTRIPIGKQGEFLFAP
jgi:hypothetical protein